jgi:3D (Asp-Asp-Asp) domain-containing protein
MRRNALPFLASIVFVLPATVFVWANETPAPATRTITMEVTAYCPCKKCCGQNARGVTASGKHISHNDGLFVAADKGVPFDTKLVIPGYAGGKAVPVLDRGGAIKGNRLDVFFASHKEALKWGRRKIEVTVIE